MKKIKSLFLAFVFALSSCTSADTSQPLFSEEYPDFFTYEYSDFMGDFAVDENGTAYLYTFTYTEEGWVDEYTLSAYDMEGNCTKICNPENAPNGFDNLLTLPFNVVK